MKKRSYILKNIPNSIILQTDGKRVISLYGAKKRYKNLKLNEIFDIKSVKKLKKLKKKKLYNATISWNKKEYEVFFKANIFYFYDITTYYNVETRLKQSLKELSSKKQELQAVFDLAANGISILNKDGAFLYANKFFQNMMGYTMQELYSHSCISLSAPSYAKSSQAAVKKAIELGSFEKFKKVCVTKSGVHLNASMSLSYIQSNEEIVMITSDITEDIKYQDSLEKQIEIEVEKRAKEHEIMCHQSRFAAMGEMIESIAHQWKQPLNSLGIIVQGLRHISNKKDIETKFLKEIEDEIMQKLNYMSQTIDDFSMFFRVSKKQENFNVLQNIEDAIRLIDVQLKEHNIVVQIKYEEIDLTILGFANEFRQAVLNIIHNSMMAIVSKNVKNRVIKIAIYRLKNGLQIDITDSGGGISKENMPKIFNPYFTTKAKGSGIGLYMSKVIIENHMEGLLLAKNIEGGVKFSIILKKAY